MLGNRDNIKHINSFINIDCKSINRTIGVILAIIDKTAGKLFFETFSSKNGSVSRFWLKNVQRAGDPRACQRGKKSAIFPVHCLNFDFSEKLVAKVKHIQKNRGNRKHKNFYFTVPFQTFPAQVAWETVETGNIKNRDSRSDSRLFGCICKSSKMLNVQYLGVV